MLTQGLHYGLSKYGTTIIMFNNIYVFLNYYTSNVHYLLVKNKYTSYF